MIPYLAPPQPSSIFGIVVHLFGALQLAGFVIAYWLAVRRGQSTFEEAQPRGPRIYNPQAAHAASFVRIVLVAGLVGAAAGGWPRGDLSSAWGGVAAVVAGGAYCATRSLDVRRAADAVAWGIVFGAIVGRAGCAIAHDHLGIRSSSWLAVRFPEGARLDMGLLEALALAVIAAIAALLLRRARPGALAAWVGGAYSAARFGLDFLRDKDIPLADARWRGLTFAQWACVPLAIAALALAVSSRGSLGKG